jgi:hypothetical protein
MRPHRPRTAAAALLAGVLIASLTNGSPALAGPRDDAALRFVAASPRITLQHWVGEPTFLDVGAHVVAGTVPFEIRAKRKSYRDPIVAKQWIKSGATTRKINLPAGLLQDFSGFPAFSHLTLKDGTGATVVDRDETFCPNNSGVRTRPDAPDRSPYPWGCPFNPFTLGSVWGIQAGWATSAMSGWWGEPVDLADGVYSARLSVNQPYRDLFGIPADQSAVDVQVTISTIGPIDGRERRAAGTDAAGPRVAGPRAPAGRALTPAAARPTGRASVPEGPKPDLRSLPAFGIEIGAYQEEPDGRDYLSFSANVWVAGDSPLVVDGFRRPDEDVMDAYQYFYDTDGNQVGYALVGEMEWDDHDEHHHWHFTDFAQYRLLDASRQLAVRSGKEAFCLANTDAVDYTLPKANWEPENTDLHSACGNISSLAVREVLDVGNGDTYSQYLPGQSFDITDVPNGTYYIEIAANPDKNLIESNPNNNTSLRKVILGGEPGARTVTVPPHHGIEG